jgi:hypothetical protein
VKRSLVELHTPDPQSTDFVLTIDNQQIRFRFVTGRYTNENGYYEFDREWTLGQHGNVSSLRFGRDVRNVERDACVDLWLQPMGHVDFR